MTSTLIGSAAPTAGDLVTTTNWAGEILVGFILQVTTQGGRIRPRVGYQVTVGSGGGKRFAWAADDCTYLTERQAAQSLRPGQTVYAYLHGDWRVATVDSIARTRATITRPLSNGGERTHTLPAWQLMRDSYHP